ncbi:unnamed protein product, partial [Linum tenue]
MSDIHEGHPYRLHPNDNHSMVLISTTLNGENYGYWSTSIQTALCLKNKISFIDGSSERPLGIDTVSLAWDEANAMVKGWIYQSIDPSIVKSLPWFESAMEVWEDLKSRFIIASTAEEADPCKMKDYTIIVPCSCFFVTISPQFLTQHKMDIPLNFTHKYGSELSSPTIFQLPTGDSWIIGVNREADTQSLFFTDNLHQFMQHYSVTIGCVLHFKYTGMSNFTVNIFNLNGRSFFNSDIGKKNNTEVIREKNVATLSSNPKDIGATARHSIKLAVKGTERIRQPDDEHFSAVMKLGIEKGIYSTRILRLSMYDPLIRCRRPIIEAILSDPKYPSYITVMTRTQITGRTKPLVPRDFVKKYITDECDNVFLVARGTKYNIRLKRRSESSVRLIGRNWLSFCYEHSLQVGDV